MGKRKWTLDKCRDEALNYKHGHEFQLGSRGAYSVQAARRNNWLDKIFVS